MFHVRDNVTYFLVEGSNFRPIKLTIPELKKSLFDQIGDGAKLPVNMVIIEQVNCKNLAEVFLELGVEHVISFELTTELADQNASNSGRNHINDISLTEAENR